MKETMNEVRDKLRRARAKLEEIRGYFDVAKNTSEIEKLNLEMAAPDFWVKPPEAQKTVQRLKALRRIVEPWKACDHKARELTDLIELVQENDEDALHDIKRDTDKLLAEVEMLEFQQLLSDPLDSHDAIVSINAGAGGTESCDWVEMLLRMYLRWTERRDYKASIVDILAGEEAGVKNVTFMVQGPYAYGYLRAECGVHRLVRISPFDANKRRHTSFASVDAIPSVEEEAEIEIKEADLKIDTYRAGGAGGQHVNKTDSAVRILHIPTGVVAQCQNERSQFQNKQTALKILKARLYKKKREEEDAELKKKYGEKKEIAWGSQIRSYVFHPYTLVKDHRTAYETSNGTDIMDGDLDKFIEAYLKQAAKGK
ncbi:MAG: peptide chain release factor 2 [Candidatus Omnitrophica bacterium]|nr:peptide chain release factor 2 [Candidatus Omnitrophota bacterium]